MANMRLEATFYKSEMYSNQKNWVKAVDGYEVVADKAPNKFAEKSLLQAARINFFNLKDYAKAEIYYAKLKDFASSQENKMEAMRGLLRASLNCSNGPQQVIMPGICSIRKALVPMIKSLPV